LVVPLDQPPAGGSLFSGKAPARPDLVIHGVELESRGAGGQLVVDFTAYTPGLLELPPLEIGGILFEGLGVEITSILGSGEESAVLSPPAPPPAVPGTGLLISGTLAGALFLAAAFLWAFFRGPRFLEKRLKTWRRNRLIGSLGALERRLRKTLIRENAGVSRREELLNFLTGEFRTFLGRLTGENCRAMTAGELSRLSLPGGDAAAGGEFLGAFFRRCDDLRFSGADIGADELLDILGELKIFIAALRAPAPEPPESALPALSAGFEPEPPL
jgi:hypothetical protein